MNNTFNDTFDRSNDDAEKIFCSLNGKDPSENICPALLNSSDIYAYAEKTSMIWPFKVSNLKSASYEVDFLGTVIYWNENGEKTTIEIANDDVFELKKHSIAFVAPNVVFRLPDYLAVRFNLQIKLVHSGILLGTGPLVDPGFEGRLLIPLHNLTNNDYVLKGGEGLIWVEFTKLSHNSRWLSTEKPTEHADKFVPFPTDKKNKKPEEFMGKATAGQKFDLIQSSIPTAITKANQVEKNVEAIQASVESKLNEIENKVTNDVITCSNESQKSISDIKNEISSRVNILSEKVDKRTNFDFGALFGLIIAFIALGVSMYSLHSDTSALVQDSVNYVKNNQKLFDNMSSLIVRQNKKIDKLEQQLNEVKGNK